MELGAIAGVGHWCMALPSLEVPVGSELDPPEGPSVFGFCDGLRGRTAGSAVSITRG